MRQGDSRLPRAEVKAELDRVAGSFGKDFVKGATVAGPVDPGVTAGGRRGNGRGKA